MHRVFVVVGTRPEAIKLAPVILALRSADHALCVCATGQHPDLAIEALDWFGIKPDRLLRAVRGQLDTALAALIPEIGRAIDLEQPTLVMIQGDTISALAGALAAYHRGIPIAHVEAGLRSGNLQAPWPEEGYRKLIATIAGLNFAPTSAAAEALSAENVPRETIYVTGNTGIDALHRALKFAGGCPVDPQGKKLLLVTCHRRESFGQGLGDIAEAIQKLAERQDAFVVIMMHPNPNVRNAIAQMKGVLLLDPLPYPKFIKMLSRAYLVLTDSGGVQEEAPSLGIPVLVMRDTTERRESLIEGTAKLVGTNAKVIVREASRILDDPSLHARMSRVHNAFGDGHAADRIVRIVNATASQTLIEPGTMSARD